MSPMRRPFRYPWEVQQDEQGPPPPPSLTDLQSEAGVPDGPPSPPMAQAGPPQPPDMQAGPPPPMPQMDEAPPLPQQGPPIPRFQGALPAGPPRPQQQAPPPPPQPMTDAYQRQQQQFQQRKNPGLARQIAGAAISIAPRLRGVGAMVSGEASRERDLQNLQASKMGADEEQQVINHQQDRALRQKQMDLTDQQKQESLYQQALLKKPAQTISDRIREAQQAVDPQGQPVYTPEEIKMIGAGWKPPEQKVPALHNVPQGSVALGPDNKPVFTNPAADKPERENPNQWTADLQSGDPAVAAAAQKKLDDMTKRQGDVARAGATARSEVANIPSKPIVAGTREFRVAQDLAYGRLTMQQFRSLTAYSRDTNKKMDIYDKASELNPNFDPAAFERGFKFSSNPKVQQQLASLDNVTAGVDDLLKFSEAAKRAGAPVLNRFIIPGGLAIGNRKYSDFNTARTAFADELSGGLGYGSATDMSREMGFNMTDPNLSPENFASAVQNVIVPFVARKRKSLTDQMGIYGQPQGQQGGPPQQAMVNLQAPDGSVKPVPADQVEHFMKLGAKRVQ